MGAFKAKYPGKYAGCGERIIPGAEVIYVDDSLCHLECEGWALPAERPVEVCPVCWLVRPCGCEDGQ